MKVVVKREHLENLIKTLAEERSFHTRRYDQIAGEDKPVLPDAQVAQQISKDNVPVGDPDFLPVNKKQLSSAASQIANQVSPDKIQKFYSGLKKLIRKTSEPKQYKGMSETDLMEVLRHFVLREARRSVAVGDTRGSYSSDSGFDPGAAFDKFKAREDSEEGERPETGFNPAASTYSPEAEEIIRGEKDPASARTGKRRIVNAKVPQSSKEMIKKLKKGKSKDTGEMSDFEILLSNSQDNIDAIFNNMLRRQTKIDLADLVVGDASRFLDEYYKASTASGTKFPIPKSLDAAKVKISVTNSEATDKNFNEKTPVRTVKFEDLESPDRGFAKTLTFVHTGGPIFAKTIDKSGKESPVVYYLLRNFPFNEQEYIAEFENQLNIQTTQRSKAAAEKILAAARAAETEEDLPGSGAKAPSEKKGKNITPEMINIAANEVIKTMESDPETFSKMLKNSGIDQSEFDSMTPQQREEVFERIAKKEYIDTRKLDTILTRAKFGFDLDRPEAEGEYEFSEAGGVVTTNESAKLREDLIKTFYEEYLQPTISFILDGFADDLAEQADSKKADSTIGDIFNNLDKVKAAFGVSEIGSSEFDEDEEYDDLGLEKDVEIPAQEFASFLSEIRPDEALFDDFLQEVKKVCAQLISENKDLFAGNNFMPTYVALMDATQTRKTGGLDPYEQALSIASVEDVSRMEDMYKDFKDIQLICRGVILAGQVDYILKVQKGKKRKTDEEFKHEFFKQFIKDRLTILELYKDNLGIKTEDDYLIWMGSEKSAEDAWNLVGKDFIGISRKRESEKSDPMKSEGIQKSVKDYRSKFLRLMSELLLEKASELGGAAGFSPDKSTKRLLEEFFKIAAVEAGSKDLDFDYETFSKAIIAFMNGKSYVKLFQPKKAKQK